MAPKAIVVARCVDNVTANKEETLKLFISRKNQILIEKVKN